MCTFLYIERSLKRQFYTQINRYTKVVKILVIRNLGKTGIYNLKEKTKGSDTTYLNNRIFNSIVESSSWTLIEEQQPFTPLPSLIQ